MSTESLESFSPFTLSQTLSDHEHAISAVKFSSNGRLLASSSADKTLRTYSFTNSDSDSESLNLSPMQQYQGHHLAVANEFIKRREETECYSISSKGLRIDPCTLKGYSHGDESWKHSPSSMKEENQYLSTLESRETFRVQICALMLLRKGKDKCSYQRCDIGSTMPITVYMYDKDTGGLISIAESRSQNHRETELLLGVLCFHRNNLPIKLFLKWTMIVEILSENKKKLRSLKMGLGIRVPLMSLTLVGIGGHRQLCTQRHGLESVKPLALIKPAASDDIAQVLKASARSSNLTIVARGNGHSINAQAMADQGTGESGWLS
ncbi:hypothetical protein K1719_007599 [Acacia pycnantha]|nr:hypothetical protein K1719_007599 [Acacia pycnantha]